MKIYENITKIKSIIQSTGFPEKLIVLSDLLDNIDIFSLQEFLDSLKVSIEKYDVVFQFQNAIDYENGTWPEDMPLKDFIKNIENINFKGLSGAQLAFNFEVTDTITGICEISRNYLAIGSKLETYYDLFLWDSSAQKFIYKGYNCPTIENMITKFNKWLGQ